MSVNLQYAVTGRSGLSLMRAIMHSRPRWQRRYGQLCAVAAAVIGGLEFVDGHWGKGSFWVLFAAYAEFHLFIPGLVCALLARMFGYSTRLEIFTDNQGIRGQQVYGRPGKLQHKPFDYPWSKLRTAEDNDGWIRLDFKYGNGVVVPESAFSNSADLATFRGYVHDALRFAKEKPAAAIAHT